MKEYPIPHESIADAKLFYGREEAMRSLVRAEADSINYLEIGVGIGEFTKQVIESFKVDKLFLIDIFDGYQDFSFKNIEISKANHKQYVQDKFSDFDPAIYSGKSETVLPQILLENPDIKFDFIYIDADHDFKEFYSDLTWSSILLKDNGIIGIDDYCFAPKFAPDHDKYQIIPALGLFLEQNPAWKVCAVALNNGFTNIFLQKK